MHFGSPLPWWLVVLAAVAIGAVAVRSYRRPLVPLSAARRTVLAGLRMLSLASLLVLLARPVRLLPPAVSGDVVVPVIVDTSRSMRVSDADGESRLAQARRLVTDTIAPGLEGEARLDLLALEGDVQPVALDTLTADGGSSDIRGRVAVVRDRYRGSRVPAIVVLSDGADTGSLSADDVGSKAGVRVFAVGMGSPQGLPDREVVSIAAGDPRLDQAAIELQVSVVSRGFGREPFDVRVLENGRLIDTRTVAPAGDAVPVDLTFTVSPDPSVPTTYTAEISAMQDEAVAENNVRSVLVSPAGRKRRILVLTGAPGYEFGFLVRAITRDPNLEVDSVVRKGQNDAGVDTYLVQASGGRGGTLTSGFPSSREALFGYDTVVVANLEGDYFARPQLALVADFVGQRGGGLLVLGGRSFEGRGLTGTPLEEVIPLQVGDRQRSRAADVAVGEEAPALQNRVVPTRDGESHPIMRLAQGPEESRARWAQLPALTAVAPVGGPRPGASVLAVSTAPGGTPLPVVAVQRYGRGRSMIFTGEASWRWRMLRPAADRSYERFWRQALRWLAADAPDPVTIGAPGVIDPGQPFSLDIVARDRAFAPVPDAKVAAVMLEPGQDPVPLAVRPDGDGRFIANATPRQTGAFRIKVDAARGSVPLGSVDRWILAGGADRELADPRLNEGFLRRLASSSGGAYFTASDAVSQLVPALRETASTPLVPVQRDLWHAPWAFAAIVGLLSAEWMLRRRWGLR